MKNSQQLLRDSNIIPTKELIENGLGTSYTTYIKFIEELKKYDISLMEWKYYNDGKSWLSKGEYKWTTPRGTNKVKPIFWLSIWKGFFKISFFFSNNIKKELLKLSLSKETKDLIKNTKPMGKTMRFLPITFDINNEKQIKDLVILSQYRKENI